MFWLRKTRKANPNPDPDPNPNPNPDPHQVVMAVLLTRKGGADDRNVFWRGMNVEARSLAITPAHNKPAP